MTTIFNCKVDYIRPQYHDLNEVLSNSENIYIDRAGKVFISINGIKKKFPPENSVWTNPFKYDATHPLEESLIKYEIFIRNLINKKNLIDDLLNLKGKNLYCWCLTTPTCYSCSNDLVDEKIICHGQILIKLIFEYETLGYIKELSEDESNKIINVPVKKKLPIPVKRELPIPVKREIPIPVKRELPIPVKRELPIPIKREIPIPVKREIPIPIRKKSPVPVKKENNTEVKTPVLIQNKKEYYLPPFPFGNSSGKQTLPEAINYKIPLFVAQMTLKLPPKILLSTPTVSVKLPIRKMT
jgi:hypothetical protein